MKSVPNRREMRALESPARHTRAGQLLHVCVSDRKGTPKHEIAGAPAIVAHGIRGDAHAGVWHRQVSLLAHHNIEIMRAKGLKLKPGAFGENLVIDGIGLDGLGVGSQLRVGPALLEITQVGKVCHTRCAIYYATGDCIMPRTGIFACVLEGGELLAGDEVTVVRRVERSVVQAAVLTVSDRCAAGVTRDTSGPSIEAALESELGARIAWTRIVPDGVEQVAAALTELADRRVDLLVTTGGTGMTERDVTPEATRCVLERELPGLAEAMRAASAQRTPHALLSRAVAGTRGQTLIVNLPGSNHGALENLHAIIPALPHAIAMLRGQTEHRANDEERLVPASAISVLR